MRNQRKEIRRDRDKSKTDILQGNMQKKGSSVQRTYSCIIRTRRFKTFVKMMGEFIEVGNDQRLEFGDEFY